MHTPLKLTAVAAASALALLATPASADDFDFNVGQVERATFDQIAEDVAAAIAYKSVQPAQPQGLVGFDVGVVASYTSVENKSAWRTATGSDVDQLGFVGITAEKGLPLNFDVAGYYGVIPGTDAKLLGVEGRYAIWPGKLAVPAVALRVGYTQLSGEDDLEGDALTYDLSVSKKFPFVEPYVGYGRVDATIESSFPSSNATEGNLGESDQGMNRLFGGVKLKLVPFGVTLEAEQTGDNTGFNLRVAIGL